MSREKLSKKGRIVIEVLLEKMGEICKTAFSIDDEFCTNSNEPDETYCYIMGPDGWEDLDPEYHCADVEDLIDVLNRIRYGEKRYRYIVCFQHYLYPEKNVVWDRLAEKKIYHFHGAG